MKKYKIFLIIILLITYLVICFLNITIIDNLILNKLIKDTILNLILSLLLFILVLQYFNDNLKFEKKLNFLWLILPFMVAIVNFPFSAIIKGYAKINYPSFIPIFLLNCIFIGFVEELFFRIVINSLIKEKISTNKKFIKYIIVTSTIFSLFHLLNLFNGAGLIPTLIQVGYTFLLGAMFTVIYDKTNNIWICVIIHAIFDFGGNIITTLGTGTFQDIFFWIFTIIIGICCAIEMIIYIIKKNNYNYSGSNF